MKKLVLALVAASTVAAFAVPASAGWVSGYTKQNGTYVQPHYRTNPNGTCWDNLNGC